MYINRALLLIVGITFILLAGLGSLSLYTTEIAGQSLLVWFTITPVMSLAARMGLTQNYVHRLTIYFRLVQWSGHT